MAEDLDITPGQAHYIIERMLADRTITRRDLNRYKKDLDSEIAELESRLANLRDAAEESGGESPGRRRGGTKRRRASKGAAKGRKKSTARKSRKQGARSRQAKKSMAVQGRYISYLRRFEGKKKERFQEIARNESREKAIEAMQAELNK